MGDELVEFVKKLFTAEGFMPRWVCGVWSSTHGWMYICANIAIWAAYFTIPFVLFSFIQKRKNLPFRGIFVWFILFIIFCGVTHLVDAIMFWKPLYRLNAVLLVTTAIISWITVVILIKHIPKALQLKTSTELQEIINQQMQELQLANSKLKESETYFKALVNNNPDLITRMGKDLTYQFVNESLTTLSGSQPSFYLGKTPAQVLPTHPHTPMFEGKLREVIETKKMVEYEIHTTAPTVGDGYFAVEMIPLFDEKNEVENVITITKNITEARKNALKLEETIANLNKLSKRLDYKIKTLQDFAYIVSHNLRSPVGNLVSLKGLYDKEADTNMKEFYVEKAFTVADQLSITVKDLSDVVNIGQNTDIAQEWLQFKTVLVTQMNALFAEIESSKAVVSHNFTACEKIQYPKIYLESIFLNLLTNAIKYSSPKRIPQIHFETAVNEEGIITLTCTDNGQGIDMEKHGKKLFSLHKTFHSHPDARGVGLFITKNQVLALGGTISAKSEVDKGTTFIINFNEMQV